MVEILSATTAEQIKAVSSLFEEYAASLQVDLCFQGFAEELATLPGLYASPRGRLLLATDSAGPFGCIAMRPSNETICEMKRLFVRPHYQGGGVGRLLVQRLIAEAKEIGYSKMILDTLPFMQSAIRLYESLGFVRRPAYYPTPIAGTVFMELEL